MKTNLVQDYKVFEGRYNEQMPLLVQEGLQSLTSKDIMQYRLQAIQSNDKDEINFWLNKYFDTVDGLAYFNKELIVVPNSQELLNVNQDTKLSNGSLRLSKEQYKELSKKHEIIKRNRVISERSLTKKEAKEHSIWLKLAQEDKSLLNEYADAIFAKAKEVYNYDKNMGVYLPNDQEQSAIRDWCLGGLLNWSVADAGDDLDCSGRLFGVRAQNLERKISQPQTV